MRKLLLMAGKDKPEGYATLDADPTNEPTYIRTLPSVLPLLGDEGWGEIAWIHGPEHLFPWEAEEVLRECLRVLAPGGVLVLEMPNVMYAAKVLSSQREPEPGMPEGAGDMWPLYGDPSHRNPLMMHKWGYTPTTLSMLLEKVGFSQVELQPATSHWPQRDFRMTARK